MHILFLYSVPWRKESVHTHVCAYSIQKVQCTPWSKRWHCFSESVITFMSPSWITSEFHQTVVSDRWDNILWTLGFQLITSYRINQRVQTSFQKLTLHTLMDKLGQGSFVSKGAPLRGYVSTRIFSRAPRQWHGLWSLHEVSGLKLHYKEVHLTEKQAWCWLRQVNT